MQVRFRDIHADILGRVMDYGYPDIAVCRLVSRSWYRAAKGKGCYLLELGDAKTGLKRVAGLALQKMIGNEWFSVVNLYLELAEFGNPSSRNIARLMPAISCLHISNGLGFGSELLFEVLSIFFENCPRIKTLDLVYFDFWPEPFPFLSDMIKDGVSCILHLKIEYPSGSFCVIVENVSIPNLKSFEFLDDATDTYLTQID
jgi:hypothetical protein